VLAFGIPSRFAEEADRHIVFVLEAFVKNSPRLLFAQRLNELHSQLSEFEVLRARIKEAERRASGAPTRRSTPKTRSLAEIDICPDTRNPARAATKRQTS
jgi:hypothetical protein